MEEKKTSAKNTELGDGLSATGWMGQGRTGTQILVRVEVVIFCVQREGAIDFQKRLRILVGLFDKPEIHLPDTGFGGLERRAKFRVEHQAFSAVVADLITRGRLSRGFAGKFESEGGHTMCRAGITVASVA